MLTKNASEITSEDKVKCIASRGAIDGTVTLYYEGEDELIPEITYANEEKESFREIDTQSATIESLADTVNKLISAINNFTKPPTE